MNKPKIEVNNMKKTQNIAAIIDQIKLESKLDSELKGMTWEYKPLLTAWIVFQNGRKATFYGFELSNSIEQIKHRGHLPLVDLAKSYVGLKHLIGKTKDIKEARIYGRDFVSNKSFIIFRANENGIEEKQVNFNQDYTNSYAQFLLQNICKHRVIIDFSKRKNLTY